MRNQPRNSYVINKFSVKNFYIYCTKEKKKFQTLFHFITGFNKQFNIKILLVICDHINKLIVCFINITSEQPYGL